MGVPLLVSAALLAAPQYLPGGEYRNAHQWGPAPDAVLPQLTAVTAGPDADLDGWADFLTTERYGSGPGSVLGSAKLWSGRDGRLLWAATFEGAEYFATAACALPDLNRDGIGELALADPERNNDYLTEGAVWILSGRDGAILYEFRGASFFDEWFGSALAPAGDVDGDGCCDLIIGAHSAASGRRSTYSGEIYVHSGRTGARLLAIKLPTPTRSDSLGASVLGVGDLDGDGVPDVIGGSPESEPFAPLDQRGMVAAFSGRSGAMLWRYDGREQDERCGVALARLPDLDGDGVADLAAGADFYAAHPTAGPGKVVMLSGRTGQMLREVRGSQNLERFGAELAPTPDIDRDGLDDLVVLAPGTPRPLAYGDFALVGSASGEILARFHGTAPELGFGAAMAVLPQWGEARDVGLLAPATDSTPYPAEWHWSILVRDPFLRADQGSVSASLGGTVRFDLAFPPSEAHADYLLAGGMSGVGVDQLLGIAVPLRVDSYTLLLLDGRARGFSGLHGRLDGLARGRATWTLAAGSPPALAGRTADFCALTRTNFLGRLCSLPVRVRITP